MSSPAVALVTGATGFVGSRISRRLLQQGFAVRALSSGGPRDRLADVADRIEWFGIGPDDIARAARGVGQFHNLAVVYDRPTFSDKFIGEVNVALPLRVIDALRVNTHPVACVLADSFFRKFPAQATAQARYTRSKSTLAGELHTRLAESPCHVALMVIEQVYGPGDSLQKVFPRIVQQLLNNVERIPLTQGDQRRDFVHVDDVVEAAVVASSGEWTGTIEIGCGSGRSTAVRSVFEQLKAITGSRTDLGFGDMPADQAIADSVGDTSWLSDHGWACGTDLESGLAGLVADVATRCAVRVEKA